MSCTPRTIATLVCAGALAATLGCRLGFEPPLAQDLDAAANAAVDASPPPDAAPTLIEDSSLVVRYFLDEAESGQGVLEVMDSAPSPLNLPLLYDPGSDEMHHCVHAMNRGLCWDVTLGDSAALRNAVDTKLKDMLHTSTAATIEVVVRIDDVYEWGSRILQIGHLGSQAGLTLLMHDTQSLSFWFDDNKVEAWNLSLSDRHVIHATADSTQMREADRMAIYIDGQRAQLYTGECNDDISCVFPEPDEQLEIQDSMSLALGNSPTLLRSIQGGLFYAAIYNRALSSEEIAAQYELLKDNDDTPLP